MTESVVEEAVLGWLDELGYAVVAGPDLALEGDHVCGSVREIVPADHGDVKARDEDSASLAPIRDALLPKLLSREVNTEAALEQRP
jgi:hypothetical protein